MTRQEAIQRAVDLARHIEKNRVEIEGAIERLKMIFPDHIRPTIILRDTDMGDAGACIMTAGADNLAKVASDLFSAMMGGIPMPCAESPGRVDADQKGFAE